MIKKKKKKKKKDIMIITKKRKITKKIEKNITLPYSLY